MDTKRVLKWVLPLLILAAFGGAVVGYVSRSPCVVLERKSCKLGEPIVENGVLVGLGFNLPAGSKIYAPFAGTWSYVGRAVIDGEARKAGQVARTVEGNDGEAIFSLIGELDLVAESNSPVGMRDLLARIPAPQENQENNARYNLIVSFAKFDLERQYFVEDRAFLEQFFASVRANE